MIEGVVMKVRKNHSILLAEGKFYKIKNKGPMEEGIKIIVTEEDIIMEKSKGKREINKYIGIAVAAAIILTMAFTSLNFGNETYAVATVDINPSVELELDKEYKVIKMIAVNKDGEELKGLKVKGMEVDNAVELIVEEAEKRGFIKEDENPYVMVTTVVINKKIKDSNEEQAINKTIKKQIEIKKQNSEVLKKVNIAINSTSKETYKEINKKYKNKKEERIPLGIYSINKKMTKEEFKSLKEFFDDDDNVKFFEKDGNMILSAKEKLNKLVDELITLEKDKKIGIDVEDLLEEANELNNKDINNKEEIFDTMEDLVDEIEDAIEDIQDKKDEGDDDEDDEDDDEDED